MSVSLEYGLRDLIKLIKQKEPSRRTIRRVWKKPTPWEYNKDDIVFYYKPAGTSTTVALNRPADGNFLNQANLRALNDNLWGAKCSKGVRNVSIVANEAYVPGENLYVPKKKETAPEESPNYDLEVKFKVTPVRPVIPEGVKKVFSAGIDPIAIIQKRNGHLPEVLGAIENSFATSHLMSTFCKNLTVFMDGYAAGGLGVSCFITAPFVVATERTSIEYPESSYGFIPVAGSIFLLSQLAHNFGIYLAMSGSRVSGTDLRHLGVAYYIPSERLPETIQAIYEENSKRQQSQNDVVDNNAILKQYSPADSEIPTFSFAHLLPTIERCFGEPTVPGIFKAVHEAKTNSQDQSIRRWAEETEEQLMKRSPLSLYLIRELFNRCSGLNVLEANELEYTVAWNLLNGYLLYEGISDRYVRSVQDQTLTAWSHSLDQQLCKQRDQHFALPERFIPLAYHSTISFHRYLNQGTKGPLFRKDPLGSSKNEAK